MKVELDIDTIYRVIKDIEHSDIVVFVNETENSTLEELAVIFKKRDILIIPVSKEGLSKMLLYHISNSDSDVYARKFRVKKVN